VLVAGNDHFFMHLHILPKNNHHREAACIVMENVTWKISSWENTGGNLGWLNEAVCPYPLSRRIHASTGVKIYW
jgi:hypothetical protein